MDSTLAIASELHWYAAVLAALLAIWLAVALGMLLGTWQRSVPRATGPIRTFALIAACAVVILSLLPHSLEAVGPAGLAVAGLGFCVIPLSEMGLAKLWRRRQSRSPRLSLSYAGLVLHRIGDGVALSVDGHGFDVMLALSAHEVPIVALVVAMYAPEGLGKALRRAVFLGIASTFGCALVRALPAPLWHGWHGWVDAFSAGILVHIVVHELSAHPHEGKAQRALDLLAAISGVVLVSLPAPHSELDPSVAPLLLERLLQISPPLVIGLLLAAALSILERPERASARSARLFPDAGEGSPVTLALTAALLGGWIAVLRALCALFTRAEGSWFEPAVAPEQQRAPIDERHRLWRAVERAGRANLGALLLSVMLASYIDAFVPPLPGAASNAQLVLGSLALLAALAAHFSSSAATVVAAAAVSKGLPPAVALAVIWLGAATARAAAADGALRSWRGRVLVLASAAALLALAMFIPGLTRALMQPAPPAGVTPLDWISLSCLGAFMAHQLLQVGVHRWLRESLSAGRELEKEVAAPPCPGHVH